TEPDPQAAVWRANQRVDRSARKSSRGCTAAPRCETCAVESMQSVRRAEPQIALGILSDREHVAWWLPFGGGPYCKAVVRDRSIGGGRPGRRRNDRAPRREQTDGHHERPNEPERANERCLTLRHVAARHYCESPDAGASYSFGVYGQNSSFAGSST